MPDPVQLAYTVGDLAGLPARSVITKSIDGKKLSITSVLTAPEFDKAGDYIHPDGGNYAPHRDTPWVGLEHYRWDKAMKDWVYPSLEDGRANPDASDEPVVVAWARESLSCPGADYSVRNVELTLEKGEKVKLPVATSYFDKSDQLSMQVFGLCERDMLKGVSVEIKPSQPIWRDGRMHKSYRPIGECLTESNRPALEVHRWDLYGFVHCRTPVNDGAMTVVPDKLIKAIQVGKIGDETMHPMLLKSLSGAVPKRRYWNVINKAELPDENLAATSVYDASPAQGSQTEPEPTDTYPTADGLYSFGQMASDAVTASRAASEIKGEHKKGMKVLRKLAQKVADFMTGVAQEAVAAAENVESDLDEEEEMEVEATDEEAAAVDTETDDDGMMKCLPERMKLILKAKRFKMSEIKAAEDGNSPADIERRDKAFKQLQRTKKIYS